MADETSEDIPTLVDVQAFGRIFHRVLPGIAEDLVTLEKEGAIYGTFWRSEIDDFKYYRVRFLPAEIVEFVEACIAQEQFNDAMEAGWDFDYASECIGDERIRDRVRNYPHAEIRGCHASFLTAELEALCCGLKPDRYQPLPDLGDAKSQYAIAREACLRLAIIAGHFSDRGRGRPSWLVENEYDIQDILFASLRSVFSDVRFEEWTPQIAGRAKRIDVVLPELDTVIEVKMIRNQGHARTVVDELMIDIESYHSHERCKHLLAVVYDPGRFIADPEAISKGLGGIRVKNNHKFDVEVLVVR
ncbi:hypothetical protein GO011_21490 [Mycobacterium sp. 20091114027_K0903767]|nr:hypothetical protein [Mycobacterium sp. 20091114027_K0903767]